MSKTLLRTTSVALAISGLLACSSETVESDTIDNEAIWAGIRITSEDGLSSGINVELNVGGSNGTNLSLSSGDRVVASSGSERVVLQEDTDFLDVDYEGVINVGGSGEEITISLERPNSTNISNSRVILPDVFNIIFPQPDMTFTQIQNLDVLWTAGSSSGDVHLIQTATCKDASNQDTTLTTRVTVPDTGRYNTDFLPESLAVYMPNGGCDFRFEIIREGRGTLDPGFGEGGFIRARQSRTVSGLRVEV